MDPLISIPESVLCRLLASHSAMAQAEYNRAPKYNDTHFSHIAEDQIIDALDRLGPNVTARVFDRLQQFPPFVKGA